MTTAIDWQFANPFVQSWRIGPEHIDHYNHVNNVAYLGRLESLAWAHSQALGLGFEHYQQIDAAMVIRRHELDYLQPCHLDDELACATWIIDCDKRLQLTRAFQFACLRRQTTVFSARTEFVCTKLSNGRARRMPPEFIDIYGNAVPG